MIRSGFTFHLSRFTDRVYHFPDRLLQSNQRRSRDDVVADVQLFDRIDLGDRAHVAIGQPVTRSDLQTKLACASGALGYAVQLGFDLRCFRSPRRVGKLGIPSRANLYLMSADSL